MLRGLHCDPVSTSPSRHPEAGPPAPPPLLPVAAIPRFVPTNPPVPETLREQSPVCPAPASQPVLGAQSRLTLCDPVDRSPQAPLSVGLSRQAHWSGLPCPPPGGLPDPGAEPPLQPTARTGPVLCLPMLVGCWVSPSATVENAALNVDEHTRRSATAGYTWWTYV